MKKLFLAAAVLALTASAHGAQLSEADQQYNECTKRLGYPSPFVEDRQCGSRHHRVVRPAIQLPKEMIGTWCEVHDYDDKSSATYVKLSTDKKDDLKDECMVIEPKS